MVLEVRPLPMREAQAFWADKVPMTRAAFDALADGARSRAMTVSGLSSADQVADVHAAIFKAVADGETLADFKTRAAGLIEAKGWNSWRVNTIFRTNLQSAYMAGRYAQMKQVAEARPYWRYVAVQDSRTRPSHMAMHGLVFHHTHPIWETWFPPNGFL